jgi:hypothetical protein
LIKKEAWDTVGVSLLDRKDMAILISDIYVEKNGNLIEFLKRNLFYAITTDGWTSEAKKKACITLTIHYLNRLFELSKISLGIITADYAHNAENLAEHLNNLLSKYGILDKVTLMVVDHASTMGSLCENMGRDFYGCLNHLLNLICKLFFECVRKCKSKVVVSDDEEFEEVVQNNNDSLLNEPESQIPNLATITEETEQQLALESADFFTEKFDGELSFEEIATKISTIVTKIKKIVRMFNKSNDLARDLLKAQKDSIQDSEPLKLLVDSPQRCVSKNILRLIQDIITR